MVARSRWAAGRRAVRTGSAGRSRGNRASDSGARPGGGQSPGQVRVDGYADPRGTVDANLKLSELGPMRCGTCFLPRIRDEVLEVNAYGQDQSVAATTTGYAARAPGSLDPASTGRGGGCPRWAGTRDRARRASACGPEHRVLRPHLFLPVSQPTIAMSAQPQDRGPRPIADRESPPIPRREHTRPGFAARASISTLSRSAILCRYLDQHRVNGACATPSTNSA